MFPPWFSTVIVAFMEALAVRRDARTRFLMLQIELLRQKFPGNRVILSPDDRARLIKAGAALNQQVDGLVGIVATKTYKGWLRDAAAGVTPRRVGRRRVVPPTLRALILRMARENHGWGVRRIVGELRKLGLVPSRSTVRRVMVEEGVLPDPDRRAPKGVTTSWRTFVSMHLDTLVACDFFCKSVWTPFGRHLAYALVFIHVGSRKVFVSPATWHPDGPWVQQQARNVSMWLEDEGLSMTHMVHDNDTKFTAAFDGLFKATGIEIVKTPVQAPIANCYAESWIGTVKRECLNHFFCFSLRHLDHIVQTYAKFYNTYRPHQSLGNAPLDKAGQPPPPEMAGKIGAVHRHELLGGLLNHYERKAA